MFSRRSRFDLTRNAFGLALERLRGNAIAVLDLTASNPTRCGFTHPGQTALAPLLDPRALLYEPQPRGREEARRAVAAYYRAHGVEIREERIFLTASTSEAYGWLFKLLADDGDAVLVPRPSYPLFDYLAGLEGVLLHGYPLALDAGFHLEPHAIAAAAGEARRGRAAVARPRALLLVSPNNPTGSTTSMAALAEVDAIAAREGLAVISDEVFADFPWAPGTRPTFAAPAARAALTFSLSGLSKVCGLPQMKLAWIAIGGPAPLVDEASARLELIADTYLSVATPVQVALPRLLEMRAAFLDECLGRIRANLATLDAALARTPSVRRLEADGGWYACLRVPRVCPEEELVIALLEQDHVAVHPGYFFDFEQEGFLVVSLIPPAAEFAEGVRRLLARIDRLGAGAERPA